MDLNLRLLASAPDALPFELEFAVYTQDMARCNIWRTARPTEPCAHAARHGAVQASTEPHTCRYSCAGQVNLAIKAAAHALAHARPRSTVQQHAVQRTARCMAPRRTAHGTQHALFGTARVLKHLSGQSPPDMRTSHTRASPGLLGPALGIYQHKHVCVHTQGACVYL